MVTLFCEVLAVPNLTPKRSSPLLRLQIVCSAYAQTPDSGESCVTEFSEQ